MVTFRLDSARTACRLGLRTITKVTTQVGIMVKALLKSDHEVSLLSSSLTCLTLEATWKGYLSRYGINITSTLIHVILVVIGHLDKNAGKPMRKLWSIRRICFKPHTSLWVSLGQDAHRYPCGDTGDMGWHYKIWYIPSFPHREDWVFCLRLARSCSRSWWSRQRIRSCTARNAQERSNSMVKCC